MSFYKKLLSWLLVFVVITLLFVPFVEAQDGDTPERTGLRPDAPLYGVRGPYPVGATPFSTGEDEYPLEGMIWYPALNPDGIEESISYDFLLGDVFPPEINLLPGYAIPDALADAEAGPYPLVVFSHGGGWVWQLSTYLFEHLASHGFVVMAFYHPGTSWPDQLSVETDEDAVTYWKEFFDGLITRADDISRAIDYAALITAGEDQLSGVIDMNRVAVLGHSTGGSTTLMSAGARLNFCDIEEWCQMEEFATESMDWMCKLYGEDPGELEDQLKRVAGWEEQAGVRCKPGTLWPSLGDSRIDVIVPFMPGPVYPLLGPAGLANITVPMLQFRSSEDTMGANEYNGDLVWNHVGSDNKTLVNFEGADHLLVSSGCSAAWRELCYFCCADPVWDVDRAHDMIDHFVTAFLLAELYGDEDAAAALSPEEVQFPGITYETTEF